MILYCRENTESAAEQQRVQSQLVYSLGLTTVGSQLFQWVIFIWLYLNIRFLHFRQNKVKLGCRITLTRRLSCSLATSRDWVRRKGMVTRSPSRLCVRWYADIGKYDKIIKIQELFVDDQVANTLESLAGTLKAAKKKAVVSYGPELLLQVLPTTFNVYVHWG